MEVKWDLSWMDEEFDGVHYTRVELSQARVNELAREDTAELEAWIKERCYPGTWHITGGRFFWFMDPDVALLFKLTWGAVQHQ